MLVLLVPPLGYGWGYRGWGPPYPRYIQRRRSQRPVAAGSDVPFNHQAWGWGGDILWSVILLGFFWAAVAIWWH